MSSTTASSFNRLLLSIAVFASLGCVALPASAAVTHILENGNLMGADNVDVDGTKYNVRFVDGTFISVFPDFPVFFGQEGLAVLASQALLDFVFLDLNIGLFDKDPELTNGCSDTIVCRALTPISISPLPSQFHNNTFEGFQLRVASAINDRSFIPDRVRLFSLSESGIDLRDIRYDTWAVWSPTNVAVIPEPATYAMMGLGLFGVMGMARRSQNQG